MGGCNPGYLRSLSVLFNGGIIITTYFLSQRLFTCQKTSIVTTGLVALSPTYCIYAQEARSYSLLLLITSLSSLALLRLIQDDRPQNVWFYGVMSTLGLYCHTLYFLTLASQGLYLHSLNWIQPLPQWHRLRNRHGLATGVSLGLFSLWLIAVVWIQQQSNRGVTVTIGADYTWNPLPLSFFFEKLGLSFTTLFYDLPQAAKTTILTTVKLDPQQVDHVPNLTLGHMCLVGFLLVLVVWSSRILGRSSPPKTYLFLVSLTLPFCLFLVKDLLFQGYASTIVRYQLPTVFALYLGLGYGLSQGLKLRHTLPQYWLSLALITLIFQSQVVSTLSYLKAETWWSKGQDAYLPEVTALIQATPQPFLLFDAQRQSMVDLLTVSYPLSNLPVQLVNPEDLPKFLAETIVPEAQSNPLDQINPTYLLYSPSSRLKRAIEATPQLTLLPLHKQPDLYQLKIKNLATATKVN